MTRQKSARTNQCFNTEGILPIQAKAMESKTSVLDWDVSSQNVYVGVLTHKVTLFGDRAFKEVSKIKWGHKGGTQIP